MVNTYTADVTFIASNEHVLKFKFFQAVMTWNEDDYDGGPTNESVIANLQRTYQAVDVWPTKVTNLKEVT